MRSESIEFENRRGQKLGGRLDLPDPGTDAAGYALFAHCFTCTHNLRVVREVSQRLVARGIGVLRFDFTGLGTSEGEFAHTTFTTNLDDLADACEHMASLDKPVGLLIGHSLGGAAALASAGRLDAVRAVATVAAPSEPAHVRHLFDGATFDERTQAAEVTIGGRPFQLGKGFVEDLDRHDLADDIGALGKPLLIFHGPLDTVVGIEHAERIFRAARHPKSFVSLDRADHLVSDAEDARYLGDVLAAWATHALTA